MSLNVFVAGATGAVGRRLVPMLRDAGHAVTAATRAPEKAAALGVLGVRAVVVDAFDASALAAAVAAAHADIVMHQLSDLPRTIDPATYPDALARNARIRVEGTPNLVAAARAAGARRLIAQSVAFAYAPGGPGAADRVETDALDLAAQGMRRGLVEGVRALEGAVLGAEGLDGLVLRYGYFWGPGTWYEAPSNVPALHVDAAAHAALLAVTHGAPGIYNIAEDGGGVAIAKARQALGFDPDFRMRA